MILSTFSNGYKRTPYCYLMKIFLKLWAGEILTYFTIERIRYSIVSQTRLLNMCRLWCKFMDKDLPARWKGYYRHIHWRKNRFFISSVWKTRIWAGLYSGRLQRRILWYKLCGLDGLCCRSSFKNPQYRFAAAAWTSIIRRKQAVTIRQRYGRLIETVML